MYVCVCLSTMHFRGRQYFNSKDEQIILIRLKLYICSYTFLSLKAFSLKIGDAFVIILTIVFCNITLVCTEQQVFAILVPLQWEIVPSDWFNIYFDNTAKLASLVMRCMYNFVGYIVCIICLFGLALKLFKLCSNCFQSFIKYVILRNLKRKHFLRLHNPLFLKILKVIPARSNYDEDSFKIIVGSLHN